jgi:hypothetical protein
MAEALGNIKLKTSPTRSTESPIKSKEFDEDDIDYISQPLFQTTYADEISYFINDNDNLVKLKGLSSCSKLLSEKYIDPGPFEAEIWPAWIKLIEVGFDED